MKPGQGEGPGRSSQALRHYRATLACPLATHVRKRPNLLRSRARLLELGLVLFVEWVQAGVWDGNCPGWIIFRAGLL